MDPTQRGKKIQKGNVWPTYNPLAHNPATVATLKAAKIGLFCFPNLIAVDFTPRYKSSVLS